MKKSRSTKYWEGYRAYSTFYYIAASSLYYCTIAMEIPKRQIKKKTQLKKNTLKNSKF